MSASVHPNARDQRDQLGDQHGRERREEAADQPSNDERQLDVTGAALTAQEAKQVWECCENCRRSRTGVDRRCRADGDDPRNNPAIW